MNLVLRNLTSSTRMHREQSVNTARFIVVNFETSCFTSLSITYRRSWIRISIVWCLITTLSCCWINCFTVTNFFSLHMKSKLFAIFLSVLSTTHRTGRELRLVYFDVPFVEFFFRQTILPFLTKNRIGWNSSFSVLRTSTLRWESDIIVISSLISCRFVASCSDVRCLNALSSKLWWSSVVTSWQMSHVNIMLWSFIVRVSHLNSS